MVTSPPKPVAEGEAPNWSHPGPIDILPATRWEAVEPEGGCLEALTREAHGRFTLADAVPLAEIVDDEAARHEIRSRLTTRLMRLDTLLPELPAVQVTDAGARRARHGNALRPADFTDGPLFGSTPAIRVLDSDGHLLCLAKPATGGHLQPQLVLAAIVGE